jgi:RNA polymerase sigma-70 factor, ECF subfamily
MLQHTTLDTLDLCAVQHRNHFLAAARRVLGDPAAAQDAVQDAMLSATRNLHRFRGESQLTTWLGRIVINAALTRRRALRRRPEESLDALLVEGDDPRHSPRITGAALASAAPSPEQSTLSSEIQATLSDAIDELPADYRTVVVMRYYQHLRITEIASRLRITPNAAKLRLLRAHRALRGKLVERGCLLTVQ